jgi:phosphoribosyl-AMP cyclohydrolase
LWHKGATSGNTQKVVAIQVDCDADTVLLKVDPAGPACHTGHTSCFYRDITDFDRKE